MIFLLKIIIVWLILNTLYSTYFHLRIHLSRTNLIEPMLRKKFIRSAMGLQIIKIYIAIGLIYMINTNF